MESSKFVTCVVAIIENNSVRRHTANMLGKQRQENLETAAHIASIVRKQRGLPVSNSALSILLWEQPWLRRDQSANWELSGIQRS